MAQRQRLRQLARNVSSTMTETLDAALVAIETCGVPIANAGPAISHQITDVLAMMMGMP